MRQDPDISTISLPANLKRYKNIQYKEGGNSSGTTLDLYIMPSKSALPLVMFIHGGGWNWGCKERIRLVYYRRLLLKSLLENGYAVASINYRLANEKIHLRESLQDCRDAVKWAISNANDYNIIPNRIALWGDSAGGHLAQLIANAPESIYSNQPFSFESNSNSLNLDADDNNLDIVINIDFSSDAPSFKDSIRCIIEAYCPTDLSTLLRTDMSKFGSFCLKLLAPGLFKKRDETLTALFGKGYPTGQDLTFLCDKFSPISYVTESYKPLLIFHGINDTVVPLDQSKQMAKKLYLEDVPHKLKIFVNALHGFRGLSKRQNEKICTETLNFLKKYL